MRIHPGSVRVPNHQSLVVNNSLRTRNRVLAMYSSTFKSERIKHVEDKV